MNRTVEKEQNKLTIAKEMLGQLVDRRLLTSLEVCVRCGMCTVRAGVTVYRPREDFSEGMLKSLGSIIRTGRGRCIACKECVAEKKKKELMSKSARGDIYPKYGAGYDRTFGHPKIGDELFRSFVFNPLQPTKKNHARISQ